MYPSYSQKISAYFRSSGPLSIPEPSIFVTTLGNTVQFALQCGKHPIVVPPILQNTSVDYLDYLCQIRVYYLQYVRAIGTAEKLGKFIMEKLVHQQRWARFVVPCFGIFTAICVVCLSALNRSEALETDAFTQEAPLNLQTSDPVRFAVIGDYGVNGPNADRVADLVKSWSPDFIVTVGDNNYEKGRAEDIDDNIGAYFRDYIHPYLGKLGEQNSGEETLVNRFFPALGNHDWDSMSCTEGLCTGPYLDYFTLPGNERYYSFEWGAVRFFVLDSDPHEPDGITPLSNQAMWLRDELQSSTATWNLAIAHHAPYSSGSRHGGHKEMQWPFDQWGIDAVLAGHDHIYERLEIDDTVYFVNGLGGKSRHGLRVEMVKGSQFSYNADYGAMLVEANDAQIMFQFITPSNNIIDSVTLYATEPPANPAAPAALVTDARVSAAEDNLIEQTATGHISYALGELVTDLSKRTYIAGSRFQNVELPPCATILSAQIEFVAAEPSGGTPSVIDIYGEKHPNASPFEMTPYSISGRQETTNHAKWVISSAWETVGESHWTPDLAPILQEIVALPGWTSGNAISFFFSGTGEHSVASYAMQPMAAPRLVVTYEVPSAAGTGAPDQENVALLDHRIYIPFASSQYCN